MRLIEPLPTTTLGDYRRHPGSQLLIVCTACGWSKAYSAERVIARLHELKAGGYPTLLTKVAARIAKRCGKCRETAWRAQFAWPPEMTESDIKRLANRYRS